MHQQTVEYPMGFRTTRDTRERLQLAHMCRELMFKQSNLNKKTHKTLIARFFIDTLW